MTRIVSIASMLLMSLVIAGAQQPGFGGGPGSSAPGNPGSARPASPQAGGAAQGGQRQPGNLVSIAEVETRTTTIGVAGRLEPARRIGHTVSIAGFVETIHVAVGERVAEGQPLVTLSRDAPGETYRPVIVSSRISGRVSEIQLIQGAEVRSGAAAVTVIDDSAYRLVAALSDKDAFRVASMGRVVLSARSADGMKLRGSLVSVSAEPDYVTGLFSATLRFEVQPGARIGMVLFIDLPVEAIRGQFVRQELIARRFGRSMMWIVDDDGKLRQVQVTTGKPYGEEVLVTGGLQPGIRYLNKLNGYEKENMSLQEYLEASRRGS